MKMRKILESVIDNDPAYHGWPTVIHTGDNRLVVVCSGNRQRHVCPYGRVWMYISEDEGKSWTGPQALSSGPLDDRDSGICQTADGALLINYFTSIYGIFRVEQLPEDWKKVAENINLMTLLEEHGFWMRRSDDGGRTWSEKYRTPVFSPHGPTLMRDGRLFFPGQVQGSLCRESASTEVFGAAFSDDNGASWQILSTIPTPPGQDPHNIFESHGIEAPDGSLIVQYRNHNCPGHYETWQTESVDGGKSWSEPHSVCQGFPSHLLAFGGGKLLMTYGYRVEPFGVRARISGDSGKTWGDEIILSDDGLDWDLGYPSTAEMADGTFFTLWYETGGKPGRLRYIHWSLE